MNRFSLAALLVVVCFSPAFAGSSQHFVNKYGCMPYASCVDPRTWQSQAPAPISVGPVEAAPYNCIKNVMGELTPEDVPICESFVASGKGSRRERATALVNLGHHYRLQRNQVLEPLRAVQALDEAIVIDPSFAEPHAVKGDIAFQFNKFAFALTHYEKALKVDPLHWRALFRKASIMQKRGQKEEALRIGRSALAAAQNNGMAHQLMGGLLEGARDRHGALVEYRKAAEAYRNEPRRLPGFMQEPSPWYVLAQLEMRMDLFESARRSIDHELEGKAERKVSVHDVLLRAEINEKAGRAADAADDYEWAIELWGPTFRQAEVLRANIAALRASAGDSATARQNFRDLIRSGNLQSILRIQVFLKNQGYAEVEIDGKPGAALERALDRCLGERSCFSGFGLPI